LSGAVIISGTSAATSDEDEDTTWTPSSSIGADATYYWCARNDDAVAQSAWTAMGSFILDTTSPDIAAIDAGASSADRISLTSDTWFKYTDTGSDDQLSFSWTDPASTSDDTFYYELNSISTSTITGDESITTNAYIDDITVAEGTNYFHVRPRNGASVWGTERTFIVKYDKTNPTVSLFSPASDTSTGDNTPTLAWSGSDATSGIAKYQLYIDSSLDTDNITNASVTPASNLTCGSHAWHIRAYDNIDNYTDSSIFNLTMACGGGLLPSAYAPPIQPKPTPENPEGGFGVTILRQAQDDNNTTVTLKLYAGGDTKRMAISNTEDFKNASQIPYETIFNYQFPISNQLSISPPEADQPWAGNDQTLTIYAKFYTQYGVASEVVSDSIIYTNKPNAVIPDGSLVKVDNDYKVYIKEGNYLRHIPSPAIFNFYNHFKWDNIKIITSQQFNDYQVSTLVRELSDAKVYQIDGNNLTKHHLNLTPQQFTDSGRFWNMVYIINKRERDYYETREDNL